VCVVIIYIYDPFDLKSGYRHFRLHRDMRPVYRLRVHPGGGEQERSFEFIALPLGWYMSDIGSGVPYPPHFTAPEGPGAFVPRGSQGHRILEGPVSDSAASTDLAKNADPEQYPSHGSVPDPFGNHLEQRRTGSQRAWSFRGTRFLGQRFTGPRSQYTATSGCFDSHTGVENCRYCGRSEEQGWLHFSTQTCVTGTGIPRATTLSPSSRRTGPFGSVSAAAQAPRAWAWIYRSSPPLPSGSKRCHR
jgi:hypothetical protein